MESQSSKPNILIIENDPRLCEALKAELEDDANAVCFSCVNDLRDSLDQGTLTKDIRAAIVQMVKNTKDELYELTRIFEQIDDLPVFITLGYDGNFQLEQNNIRSWTDHIYFRPFDVGKLVSAVRSEMEKQ